MNRAKIIAAIAAALVAGFALGNMGVSLANTRSATPSTMARPIATAAVSANTATTGSTATTDTPAAPGTVSPTPKTPRSGATRRYCQPRYQASSSARTSSSTQRHGDCWNHASSGTSGSGTSGSRGGCGW